MPIVKYDGPQVKDVGMPDVKVQNTTPGVEAFGAGQGKIMGEIGDLVMRAKKEADETAVANFENQIAQYSNDDLFDDKNGALNIKGEAAFNLSQERGEKLDKYANELKAKLQGASQIGAAQAAFTKVKMQHHAALEKHSAAQYAEFSDGVNKNGMKLGQQAAITNYFDEKLRAEGFAKITENIEKFGARNGLSREEIDMMKLSSHSETHSGVVKAYINGNQDGKAEEYFKAHEKEFSADDRASTQQLLEGGALLIKGQRGSDKIFTQYRDNETGAFDAVKKMYLPGKERDAVEKQLDIQFRRYKAAVDEQEDATFNEAWNKVRVTGDINSIKDVWGTLKHKQQAEILRMQRDGYALKDNAGTINYLNNVFTDPELAKAEQLSKHLGDLTPGTYARFEEKKAKLMKNDSEAIRLMNDEYLAKSGVRSLLEKNNITDDQEVFKFNESLRRTQNLKEQQLQRPLFQEEIDAEAKKLMINQVVESRRKASTLENLLKHGVFGAIKYRNREITERQKTPLYKTTLENIDPAEMGIMRRLLINKGIEPTPENIMDLYMDRAAQVQRKLEAEKEK